VSGQYGERDETCPVSTGRGEGRGARPRERVQQLEPRHRTLHRVRATVRHRVRATVGQPGLVRARAAVIKRLPGAQSSVTLHCEFSDFAFKCIHACLNAKHD
jgi:hypothetical protein